MNQTGVGQVDADPDDLQVCVGGGGQELRHGGDREVLAVGARKVKAVDQTVKEITQLWVASSLDRSEDYKVTASFQRNGLT